MISRTAMLDELVKIGAEAIKKEEKDTRSRSLGPALRAMAVGAGGGAIGYALAHLVGRKLDFFQNPHPGRLRAAKIILPILGGAATMLADRYRQKMNEEYNKVKGYGDRGKRA
jgi:hypothetical protein